jgi:hypothetical protein
MATQHPRPARRNTATEFLWALFARLVIVGFVMLGLITASYVIQASMPPAAATVMCAEKIMYIDPNPGEWKHDDPVSCEVTS